jgi:predicted permease
MADMKIKDMCADVRLLIFSGLKLLLIPIVGVMLIRLTGASPLFVGVSMIMLGTPVGSMTAMLAQMHDSNADLASRGVALTTVLSVITLPIVSLIVL